MYQSIHFKKNSLTLNTHSYLRKHDILYYTPSYKGYEGLPLGNGDLGGMLFHTPYSLEFVFNKIDVIDFASEGNFNAWAWEAEETHTNPISCGKLSITDSMPSFDWMYLKHFEERLNLSDASIELTSSTPFSSYKVRSFITESPSLSVFEVTASSDEKLERKITFEKWSSPSFFHYYEQVIRTYDKNLSTTHAATKDGCIYIHQNLKGTDCILCAKLVADDYIIHQLNSHAVEFVLSKSKNHTFTLLTTVVTNHTGPADLDLAIDTLNRGASNISNLFNHHQSSWHNFWDKSFIHLSEDDYVENIYYMNLYQLNSCSRGKYPITFASLWNWFKDSRNWGHFYHWNHQQTYWGVHTSNHPELATNYYNYRFNMLDHAKSDALALHQSTGAYFSDISNLNGYQAIEPDTIRNLSVGAQISLDFYKHYQYTQDLTFLETYALPFMQSCMKLYCDLLTKDSLGIYHITGGSTPYESYWNLKDTITDYAMIKSLATLLLNLQSIIPIDSTDIEKYSDIVNHLFDIPLTTLGDLSILSTGVKWNNEPVAFNEGDYPLSPFPGCELAPIYPAGIIGLKDKGSELFNIAVNASKLIIDTEVYQSGPRGCSGHTPIPQVAARLGMCEDTLPVIRKYVEHYQVFPNALGHFANIKNGQFWSTTFTPHILEPTTSTTHWSEMHEKNMGNRTELDSEYFLHNYFEATANIMTGINEMLLQSHDGIIRVFPATPPSYSAIFTLLATGNFLVTSEKNGEDIRYIYITSITGGLCKVYNPWSTSQISLLCNNESCSYNLHQQLIAFEALPNQSYTLTQMEYPLENYYIDCLPTSINKEVKTFGKNMIGKLKPY